MKTLTEQLKAYSTSEDSAMSYADLLKKRSDDAQRISDEIDKERKKNSIESIFGRSCIMLKHQSCTLSNFEATTEEQLKVKKFATDYVLNFKFNTGGGFFFAGKSRTGKNHLAAAICNNLMKRGKTCMVVTVAAMMIKLNECYGSKPKYSEEEFTQSLIGFDLLVLDEVGLQRWTPNERVILNHIVDKRNGANRPTGMLTNYLAEELESEKMLGIRMMKRMGENGGDWWDFNWPSYKKK